MKTDELVQLLALGVVGYLAYQKFSKPKDTNLPVPDLQPSKQHVALNDPNWGLNNPGDDTWNASSNSSDVGFWASLWEGL